MRVDVGVLGPVVARVDGRPLDLGGPRQRALLARLAVADGEVVHAERLLHDLWPGGPGPRSVAALHIAVSNLRRVLEPDRTARAPARVLVTAAPGYALRVVDDPADPADGALLDARLFTRAVASGPTAGLAEALRLWRGPAYADVADTAWAAGEAERLDELRLVARERLAAGEIDGGRPDAVVADLDVHVRTHPLREGGVRLLALALYRAGRGAEALDVLRRARRLLQDEHGLDPGPALRELEVAILRQDPVLAPAAALQAGDAASPTSDARQPPSSPELVGRADELTRLGAVAARVAAGGATELVTVTGEAGAGKSALLDGFAARLRADPDGWVLARGRCPEPEGGAPAGWPWSEVVAALTDSSPVSMAGPAFARGRAVLDALTGATARGPVLVTVDDLHRADDETLRLLRMVAAAGTRRTLLVAARRPDSDTDADGAEALASTFAASAATIGDRLALPGLSGDAVVALAAREGVALDVDEADRTRERTGGNPLFVREVVRLARSVGWAAAHRTVPDGVRDVLRRRLAVLPARTRTVLSHTALLGRDVAVDVLLDFEAALRPDEELDEDAVLAALETGELAGVLTGDEKHVAFAHDLWREVLDETLPRLRRSRRHATALHVLSARSDDAGHVAALARHALAAGDRVALERTLELVARAADDAAAHGASRQAVALWTAGRDAALARRAPPTWVLEQQCGRIGALARAGAGAAMWDERDAAVDRARALDGPEPLARVLTATDAPTPWPDKIHPGRQLAAFAQLLDPGRADGWSPPPAQRVRLLAGSALDAELADPQRSDAHSAEALDLARELGEPRLLCAALDARFLASSAPEAWPRVRPLGAEMMEVATAQGYADYRCEAHHVLFSAATLDGDIPEALAHADAAVRSATAGQLDVTLNFVGMFRGIAAVVEGRLDDAERMFRREVDRLVASGAANAWAMGVAASFVVGHARGDASACVPDLAAIAALGLPPQVYGALGDMYATALLDAGRSDEARAVWRPEMPFREWSWLPCAALRADLAVRVGHRDVADALRDQLAPWSGRHALSGAGLLVLPPVDLSLARVARLLGRPDAERCRHLDLAEGLVAPGHPWRAAIAAERRA